MKTYSAFILLTSGVFGHGAFAQPVTAGAFTPTGNMTIPRINHTATLLTNGKVLIVGGHSANPAATATAELYDPDTGVFTPTGDMRMPRAYHTATLLPGGRVLIAGGADYVCPNSCPQTACRSWRSMILSADASRVRGL